MEAAANNKEVQAENCVESRKGQVTLSTTADKDKRLPSCNCVKLQTAKAGGSCMMTRTHSSCEEVQSRLCSKAQRSQREGRLAYISDGFAPESADTRNRMITSMSSRFAV